MCQIIFTYVICIANNMYKLDYVYLKKGNNYTDVFFSSFFFTVIKCKRFFFIYSDWHMCVLSNTFLTYQKEKYTVLIEHKCQMFEKKTSSFENERLQQLTAVIDFLGDFSNLLKIFFVFFSNWFMERVFVLEFDTRLFHGIQVCSVKIIRNWK